MRVVAVAAGDAAREHLALAERLVVVHLAHHLAVGLEQAGLEQAREVGVEELAARPPRLVELRPPGVAHAAGLELDRGRPGPAARRLAGLRVRRPVDALALVEVDGEPVVPARAGRARLAGPGDVGGAGPVAGLAGDVDLGPARPVAVARRLVVLAQVGRVALGAGVVPGLVAAGPVDRLAGVDVLARVEVEPALPALLLRPRVPGDAERLQAPVREGDQVLLQRVDAERVADLEVGEPAVGPVRVDEVAAVAREEPRGDAAVGEGRVAEVAEDRGRRRLLHREVVVRAAPGGRLGRVAPGAGGRADVAVARLGDGPGPGRRQDEGAGDRGQGEEACRSHRDPGPFEAEG